MDPNDDLAIDSRPRKLTTSTLNSLELNVAQAGPEGQTEPHLSLGTFFSKNTSFLSVLDPTNRFLGVRCVDIVGALFFQSFNHVKVMLL